MPETHAGIRSCTAPGVLRRVYCAGGHGHLDTLQLLLNAGADCDVKFTHDAKSLMEWLAQDPDDVRFRPIAEALRRHKAGA